MKNIVGVKLLCVGTRYAKRQSKYKIIEILHYNTYSQVSEIKLQQIAQKLVFTIIQFTICDRITVWN